MRNMGPNLTLPLVETLFWNGECDHVLVLDAVLRCLPNLTAIHHVSGANNPPFSVHSLAPKLKMLAIIGGERIPFKDYWESCSQLLELRIEHVQLFCSLANELRMCCPNLKLLEVSVFLGQIDAVEKLLNTHLGLEELVLHGLAMGIKVATVASYRNIKRLTIAGYCMSSMGGSVAVAADIMLNSPHLDFFKSCYFTFSRSQRTLEMTWPYLTAAHIGNIVNSCKRSLVGELSVKLAFNFNNDASMGLQPFLFADKNGCGTLTSLTLLEGGRYASTEMLLQRCGATLRSFDVINWGYLEGKCSLSLIATTCPQLTSLSLRFGKITPEDEDGFPVLFSACAQLKELQ